MKKTYITPTQQVAKLKRTPLLCTSSLPVSNEETNIQMAPGLPDLFDDDDF